MVNGRKAHHMPEDILSQLAEVYQSKEKARASVFSDSAKPASFVPLQEPQVRRFSDKQKLAAEKQQAKIAQSIGLADGN